MCNAWQHPPGCTCGWGGDGHLGKRAESNSYSKDLRIFDRTRLDSYLNPNARCPVCGASVYFYKSENGGRVFFDELGPPWPKHPCTEKSKSSYQTPLQMDQYFLMQRAWQKNSWFPVLVENLPQKSAYAFTIERIGDSFSHRIDIMIYGLHATELMKNDLIIFAKRAGKECFTLAIFDINDNVAFQVEINHIAANLDKFFSNDNKKIL